MGNATDSDKGKIRIEPDEELLSLIVEMLSSNLARAIEGLSARFVALDKVLTRDPLKGHCRYIESVAEQDRKRLHAGMAEVLDAIHEYARGLERRVCNAAD